MITPFSRFREKEDIVSLLDDDNKLVIPICQNILFLANKMLDPESDSFLAFNKEQAPIVGLYHKQVRYFKYYVEAYQAGNADLCFLLNRIIYEAYIKMRYLMDYPYDVKEYRALSFKPHINILDNQKLSRTPHTQVLKRKFKSALEMEDLTIDDIKNARRYPGGKTLSKCTNYMKIKIYILPSTLCLLIPYILDGMRLDSYTCVVIRKINSTWQMWIFMLFYILEY